MKRGRTYRSDLRELNERNFQRFEAKLEQRIAESEGRVRQEITVLGADLRTEFRTSIESLRSELINWMFLFWVGTALTVIGIIKF